MALLRGMPNLLDLDATWMDADLLASLVYLQKLERLSISRLQGSQSEENEFFEPSFQGSRRIVELNMADSSQMTDSALVSITRTCPQIRVLIVSGNKGLTHEGLIQWCEQIATSSSSSSSSSASLHHHPNYSFTNSRLYLSKAPVVGMTELTTINFANCNQIQSTGFQALFECSRNLQHVNLMSTRVEDAALQVLASQNKSLKSLVLNCCAAISNLGLQTLLRQCRQLRAVSFLYCHRITIRVFFQNLWKCLGLQELRFSLNGRHMDLIEHGLTGGAPAPVMEVNPSAVTTDTETETETGIQGDASSVFYEPQLEYLVYGGPELDDTPMNSNQLSASVNNINTTPMSSLADHFHRDEDNSFSSVQEYRQHLILTQVYRQIEQLTQLSVLDMRDIHLPLDLAKGFSRLGHLEKLQVLELTGLGQPLGQPEVDWLLGAMNQDTLVVEEQSRREKTPLPSLHQLVFKGGYSMSTKLLQKLKDHRPCLEVQLTQVKDLA
ncbi:hypothetical protein BC939DRAFT_10086 [Gamsiella multidivaricata]|uniref:uncharacterized protein n=1 Tax=Gamsiella multidivaricata TaxID=101098 RepID=UPI00221E5887|nr:uncharacterized protein BC939DRAFT_10086 [Gamsiella multidivaricata]KAI7829517.1 hypothetical protein BC939DRAFT_10086 [Gamsiella multidivaricata]